MSKSVQPPRGFKDFLPPEAGLKQRMVERLNETYNRWGFLRVEAPSLESIELLRDSDGGENTQMIFEVLKRGDKLREAFSSGNDTSLADLALRYDLTVPLSRLLAGNQTRLPKNVKVLQHGDVWRAERPQKGRFRQFTQWDADVFGYGAPNAEIDLICCTSEALLSLGIEGFTVRVNDRRILDALMKKCSVVNADQKAGCLVAVDKLDKIGIDGIEQELQALSLPRGASSSIVNSLRPFITSDDYLDLKTGLELLDLDLDFEWQTELSPIISVCKAFSGGRFDVVFDPSLVRGLGYYTGPIFEIEYKDYPFSIAGGGRYDNILEKYQKHSIPGCGFSLGFDRILYVLSEERHDLKRGNERRLVVMMKRTMTPDDLKEFDQLRGEYSAVSVIDSVRNQKKMISEYKGLGYTDYAVLNDGDTEIRIKQI